MKYHSFSELQGKTLQFGDLVGLCSIGHIVENGFLENLGGCGDLWVFEKLGIDDPEKFCEKFCENGKVFIDTTDDTLCFKRNGLQELTAVVVELMKISAEQEYDENYEEGD